MPASTPTAMPATAELDETEATAAAYRAHADAAWGLLGRLGVAREDREDALQEVFLVVHRGWARFEGRAALSTWIHGITVRVALAHRRRRDTAARRTTALDGDPIAIEPDPHEGLEQRDAARVLDGLLDELEHDKRTVFVLSDVQGLPVPAVAQMLALNVRTAYSRLRVARADFERALQRWQAKRKHVESPPPALAQLRRRAHEHAPRRTWIAIAAAIESGRAAGIGAAFGIGGAGLAGAAAVLVAAVAIVAGTWPRDRGAAEIAASEPIATAREPIEPEPAAAPRDAAAPVVVAASDPPPAAAAALATTRADSRTVAPVRPVEAVATDTTAAEIELLRRARAEVRSGAAEHAITLLDAHARMANDGRFTAERELLRIEALCGLDRRDDALAAARAWAQHHPGATADELMAQRCR